MLITAFVGTGSSFLAFATIAAKRGLTEGAYPMKGLYYIGGLTEGTETIRAFHRDVPLARGLPGAGLILRRPAR